MASVVDKLRIVLEEKKAIKAVLDEKGKEPTDKLNTYAGLISELDNEEQVSYVLKTSNGSRAFAQLASKAPVTLTATANDIRKNTSAITNTGYTDGEKEIPAYYSGYGTKLLTAGSDAKIDNFEEYDYKTIMVTIAPFNSDINGSTAIKYASVENSMYESKVTAKLSDITIDSINKQVNLGFKVSEMSVLRYFIVREE